jgi:acetolactate synthase regulatory subunit
MEKFKFRAECLRDVEELVRVINHGGMEVNMTFFDLPDLEVTVLTHHSLETLIEEANRIDDCHVIAQTIQPIMEYTGEREWSRSGV